MNTNKYERFCGEAALECGGLTPLSGITLAVVKFWRFSAYLADKSQ